jgi:hypothetical protein
MGRRLIVLGAALVGAALVLAACAGATGPAGPTGPEGPVGPQGPEGPAGPAGAAPAASDLTCTQCHNSSQLINGHEATWALAVHGSGPAFAIAANRVPCAACHSGGGFSERISAGTNPEDVTTADPNPSRIDCRACHQIHTTYTSNDWALETTDPVDLYASEGATFDGGMGNLCANCHQQRSSFPTAKDGMVSVTSTHWGGHHGPEAALLLGVGGAGVEGKPSPHYQVVKDTCVTCHMGGAGSDADHHFMPVVATCVACHTDATSLDIDGKQTEVKDKLAQVETALQTKGLLDKDGVIVVGDYPEAQAAALWNYLFILDDKSNGVHNVPYTEALLDSALAALK